MMRAQSSSLLGLVGMLALGGCADMVIGDPPRSAERWRGTTTAGPPEIAGCGPLAIDVAVYQDPLYLPRLVDGRAEPAVAPTGMRDRGLDLVTTWFIGGYVSPGDAIQIDAGRQRPVYFRAKPYAVWRGTLDGGRATLAESGSPCGRQLVLTRG